MEIDQIEELKNKLAHIKHIDKVLSETTDETAEMLRQLCADEHERISKIAKGLANFVHENRDIFTSEENEFREIEELMTVQTLGGDEYEVVDYSKEVFTNDRIVIRFHKDSGRITFDTQAFCTPIRRISFHNFTCVLKERDEPKSAYSFKPEDIDYSASPTTLRERGDQVLRRILAGCTEILERKK